MEIVAVAPGNHADDETNSTAVAFGNIEEFASDIINQTEKKEGLSV
jgi:hypothetical protein